jgi:signal transduction histidine kinase
MRRSAVLEERLRIARDLHDVVGHGLGAITVQAGTGRMALAAGAEDEVRRALLSIEQAGRGVLREVRWLVGVLRDRPMRSTLVTCRRWPTRPAARDSTFG